MVGTLEAMSAKAVRSPRRDSRRTELLEATIRAIAKLGARSVRVEDVAREANVSTPLVYYYFESRDHLVAEAFQYANIEVLGVPNVPIGLGDGRERVTQYLLLEIEADDDLSRIWAFWSEMAGAAVFDETLREPINQGYRAWSAQIAQLIEMGQQDGSVDPQLDVATAADTLACVMDGLGSRWITGGFTNERAQEIAVGAIERQLGPRPQKPRAVT
jgi:AcrR family transcriptional regulator